ncbi:MAG: ATP-binding domain-containing protein [Fimbriimonadaceae bacterium]|nr:ATP-binding domain-containing protein [Fimbriimonadaceae bacterium]
MSGSTLNPTEIAVAALADAWDYATEQPRVALQLLTEALLEAVRRFVGREDDPPGGLSGWLEDPAIVRALGPQLEVAGMLAQAGRAAQNGSARFTPGEARDAVLAAAELCALLGCPVPSGTFADVESPSPRATDDGCEPGGRVIPDWAVLNGRPANQRLTEGERYLVEHLDRVLAPSWNLYVQPYLLGLRPDVVLLDPLQGVVHIEVKDWNLDRLRRGADGVLTVDGSRRPANRADPLLQTKLVRDRFLDGPLAVLHARGQARKRVLSLLYLHRASPRDAARLFPKDLARDIGVLGRAQVEAGELNGLIERLRFQRTEDEETRVLLGNLHAHLVPPSFVDAPLQAQAGQKRLVLSKWQAPGRAGSDGQGRTFVRIRGGAGTGKSHVLALRAANAALAGKRVLVTSFQITMANFLNGLVRKAATGRARERITTRHFHGLIYDRMVEAGLVGSRPSRGRRGDDGGDPEPHLLDRFGRGLDDPDLGAALLGARYDAIYVDEGQDMDAAILATLGRFLADGGELVLFADARQDVHGQTRLWSRLPVPFERWIPLRGSSKRLPDDLARWLNGLAHEASVGDAFDTDLLPAGSQGEFDFGEGAVLRWLDCDSDLAAVEAVPFAIESFGRCHPSDIVVLANRRDLGLRAVGRMVGRFGQNTVLHTFGDDLERRRCGSDRHVVRRQKCAFFEGVGQYKATTIHSFKGWESRFVVLLWSGHRTHANETEAMRHALLYTGASRSREGLIVLNGDDACRRFRTPVWKEFWSGQAPDRAARWRSNIERARPHWVEIRADEAAPDPAGRPFEAEI